MAWEPPQNPGRFSRRTEQNALRAIITELERNPHPADPQPVRGAGTTARTDAIITARQEAP